jgi:hypothetical protein
MRLPGEELAEHVTAAVNAAPADLRSRAPADKGRRPIPAAVAERMREIQDQGLRTMEMITQALTDVLAQVRERTGVDGDLSPRGLADVEVCRWNWLSVSSTCRSAGDRRRCRIAIGLRLDLLRPEVIDDRQGVGPTGRVGRSPAAGRAEGGLLPAGQEETSPAGEQVRTELIVRPGSQRRRS